MRYYDLLIEYNKPKLLQQYQSLFDMKSANDHKFNLEQSLDQLDEYLKQNNIQKTIDPYVKWIIHRYVTDGIRYWEDVLSKVVPALVKYDKLKKKKKLQPNEMDINKLKGESDLLDVVEKYQDQDTMSGAEKEKEIENNFYKTGQAELVMNTNEYKIVIPKTHEASCYFGRNTRWCTTSHNASYMFDNYSRRGPLYIILHKPTNQRWQFHFPSNQFMNEKDRRIDLTQFKNEHPEVIERIIEYTGILSSDKKTQRKALESNPEVFMLIDNPPKEMLYNAATLPKFRYLIPDVLKMEGKPTSFEGNLKTGLKKLNKYQPAKVKAIYKALPVIEKYVDEEINWKTIEWQLKQISNLSITRRGLGANIKITGYLKDGTPIQYIYAQGSSDMSGQRLYKIGKNAMKKIGSIDMPGRNPPKPSEQLRKIFDDILKK